MKRFLKTKQLLLIYGLAVLILAGAYGFFLIHIQGKSVNASVFLSQIEQLQNQNNQLSDLNAILKEIRENKNNLDSYFVDGEKIVDFLETVETLGSNSGAEVDVRSLNEEETEDPAIKALILNLTVRGSWNDVYYFLALIQNLPMKTTFDRIQMSSGSAPDDGGIEWRAVINMKVLELTK